MRAIDFAIVYALVTCVLILVGSALGFVQLEADEPCTASFCIELRTNEVSQP